MGDVHVNADVADTAVLGAGTTVWQFAQIREGAVLGENCIVGRGVYVGPGVHIGHNSLEDHAGRRANLCSNRLAAVTDVRGVGCQAWGNS